MKSGKMLTKVQRRRQRRMRRAAVFAAVGLAVGVVPSVSPFGDDRGEAYAAANVPPGFSDSLVAGGFLLPTVVDFLPDGRMLVADKGGFIHVVQNGAVLPTPLIDLSSKVSDNWDRGLLGMAVDPDFATTGHLFLLYVFQDPQPDDVPKKTHRDGQHRVAGVGSGAHRKSDQPWMPGHTGQP